ncbi:MAG: lysine 2,3-aminomutase [Acetobacteraceae bacterium]|nr:lysine 2,3-aminomutase [Acetobacteraceae bacterium]
MRHKMRAYQEIPLFKDVGKEDWDDWQWQVRHRITTVGELKQVIPLRPEEEFRLNQCLGRFRMAITPYYASLMDPDDPACPIRRQAVPSPQELRRGATDLDDPLGEEAQSVVPGLTHRYPDRVLLLITDQCAMYCRHCTRRRLVGATDRALSQAQVDRAIDYIRRATRVRDVVVSGGDPLLCSDERLEYVLRRLRAIPHVEIIRIGTRTPVVLPQRITPALCRVISRYHPVFVNLHFNHPRELTPEAREACARLADAGVPLGNQTVLLKGVNDCPRVMRSLMHGLLVARVRPYYLFQCDQVTGVEHFRTPVARGIEIMESLRGHTSGLAVPTYVIDGPGGAGKIPVGPQYLLSQVGNRVILRNYLGKICAYTEPAGAARDPGLCPLCGGTHQEYALPAGGRRIPGRRSLSVARASR